MAPWSPPLHSRRRWRPATRMQTRPPCSPRPSAAIAAAQGVLFHRYRERVARQVLRMCGDPAAVDDIVQDVFIAAFAALPRFRGDAQLGTWLYTIATNRVRNYWDAQRRRKRREDIAASHAPDAAGTPRGGPRRPPAARPLLRRPRHPPRQAARGVRRPRHRGHEPRRRLRRPRRADLHRLVPHPPRRAADVRRARHPLEGVMTVSIRPPPPATNPPSPRPSCSASSTSPTRPAPPPLRAPPTPCSPASPPPAAASGPVVRPRRRPARRRPRRPRPHPPRRVRHPDHQSFGTGRRVHRPPRTPRAPSRPRPPAPRRAQVHIVAEGDTPTPTVLGPWSVGLAPGTYAVEVDDHPGDDSCAPARPAAPSSSTTAASTSSSAPTTPRPASSTASPPGSPRSATASR
jgi:RNA polymerase sigma factor (sigma-70 family)